MMRTLNETVDEYVSNVSHTDSNVPESSAISITHESTGRDGGLLSFYIRNQPLAASRVMREQLWCNSIWNCKSVVCMSATITTGGDFTSFLKRTGFPDSATLLSLPCVFDYKKQMKLYISRNEARSPSNIEEYIKFIQMSNPAGGALLLFNSLSQLDKVHRGLCDASRGARPIMKAGEDVDAAISFLKTPGAVVCGCRRYWTGIDVDTIGLVGIDVMPFAYQASCFCIIPFVCF